MATAPRQTTATAKIVGLTNTVYSDANKTVFPFEASRVSVLISSVTGNDDLVLSLDGVNDSAMIHHTAQGDQITAFELQRVKQLWYKSSGPSTFTFIINAETQAWPTSIG